MCGREIPRITMPFLRRFFCKAAPLAFPAWRRAWTRAAFICCLYEPFAGATGPPDLSLAPAHPCLRALHPQHEAVADKVPGFGIAARPVVRRIAQQIAFGIQLEARGGQLALGDDPV